MRLSAIIFFSVLYSLVILASLYIGSRFFKHFPRLREYPKTFWGGVFLLIILQISGHLLYRRVGVELHPSFFWLSFFALGTAVCFLFYIAIGDISTGAVRLLRRKEKKTDLDRRTFLGMVGLGSANVVLGSIEAATGPKVYEVTVPVTDLPESFDGYKIVQISDLHVGPSIRGDYVRRVRDIANELDADMVALTGDLLDGHPESIRHELEPVSEIRSKDGTFFVTGNHEYYWGYPKWEGIFRQWGFIILENSSHFIAKGDDRIAILGLPDDRALNIVGTPVDLAGAMRDVSPEDKKILLAHRPHVFDEENRYNIDLQLSGHTHGGQFFPWSLLIGAIWQYHKGLYNHNGTWIYVNRATGYWGPPMRAGVAAEITRLVLKKAEGRT